MVLHIVSSALRMTIWSTVNTRSLNFPNRKMLLACSATHTIIRTHLGNAVQDPTSLSAHKDLLRRVWDVNKPNYAAAKSLIRHSLIA